MESRLARNMLLESDPSEDDSRKVDLISQLYPFKQIGTKLDAPFRCSSYITIIDNNCDNSDTFIDAVSSTCRRGERSIVEYTECIDILKSLGCGIYLAKDLELEFEPIGGLFIPSLNPQGSVVLDIDDFSNLDLAIRTVIHEGFHALQHIYASGDPLYLDIVNDMRMHLYSPVYRCLSLKGIYAELEAYTFMYQPHSLLTIWKECKIRSLNTNEPIKLHQSDPYGVLSKDRLASISILCEEVSSTIANMFGRLR